MIILLNFLEVILIQMFLKNVKKLNLKIWQSLVFMKIKEEMN